MSPLAFKSNNSRPMRRTTLPDTAFERTDNFLSNECIHTRFPFQIASSQTANQKWSGFCVFRFQTDFDEREHFVLSSLYRNIYIAYIHIYIYIYIYIYIAYIYIATYLHLIRKMCTKHPRPTRASIIFSSHWSLCSKRSPRLAMHPFRRFVKACMALKLPGARRYGPSRASDAPSGCQVDILDLYGTPASSALPIRIIM